MSKNSSTYPETNNLVFFNIFKICSKFATDLSMFYKQSYYTRIM